MKSTTEVKIYKTPKKVFKTIAKEIFELTLNSAQPRFDIALSGGNSPKGLFKRMLKDFGDIMPWDRIHFWWGDERCVSPDDKQSNYKLTWDTLLSHIDIPAENIHRIRGEEAPESEAQRYAGEITDQLNNRDGRPVFDLIILGLGEDGHTASIFPDQIELIDAEEVCAVATHPITGQNRITLTGEVINNSNRIYFLVTGSNKNLRIGEIMNDNDAAQLLPAYYITSKQGQLVWFLDDEAAEKI